MCNWDINGQLGAARLAFKNAAPFLLNCLLIRDLRGSPLLWMVGCIVVAVRSALAQSTELRQSRLCSVTI